LLQLGKMQQVDDYLLHSWFFRSLNCHPLRNSPEGFSLQMTCIRPVTVGSQACIWPCEAYFQNICKHMTKAVSLLLSIQCITLYVTYYAAVEEASLPLAHSN